MSEHGTERVGERKVALEDLSDELDIQRGSIKLAKKVSRYYMSIEPPPTQNEQERAHKILSKAASNYSDDQVAVYAFEARSLGYESEHRDYNFCDLGRGVEKILDHHTLQAQVVELQSSQDAQARQD